MASITNGLSKHLQLGSMSSSKSQVLILPKKRAKCSHSLRKEASSLWRHSTIGRLHWISSLARIRAHAGKRFHPATRRVKAIIDSGELGTLTKIEVNFGIPGFFVKDSDIRMVYDLGGGAMMDMGCEFSHAVTRGSIALRCFPQATPCPCRVIWQMPSRERSSAQKPKFSRSSLELALVPPLRLPFPPREEAPPTAPRTALLRPF